MKPRILTALPVYNEVEHVGAVLQEVLQYCPDVLAVDDGSTDGTSQLLASIKSVTTLTHAKNQGYGAALRSGFNYAIEQGFDVLVTIDCDGQHQPRLIPEMARHIFGDGSTEPVDIVSGSRYLAEFAEDGMAPEERLQINRTITQQLNRCFSLNLTDAFCGFKAYRVSVLHRLNITELGYAMPLQLWVQAAAQDFRIVEMAVPRIYLDEKRSFGGSLDDAECRMAYYQQVLKREFQAFQIDCGCGAT